MPEVRATRAAGPTIEAIGHEEVRATASVTPVVGGCSTLTLGDMSDSAHEELLRLAEAVPAERIPAATALLRQLVRPTARREFSCTGTLSAEPDLAERSEEVLRDEIGRAGSPE